MNIIQNWQKTWSNPILFNVNVNKRLLATSALAAFALTACADGTVDTDLYYNEESELVFDHTIGISFEEDTLDLIESSSEEDFGDSVDNACNYIMTDFTEEYGQDIGSGEISADEGSEEVTCYYTLNSVDINGVDLPNNLYGIDIAENEEENEIHVILDGEEEPAENWITMIEESGSEQYGSVGVEFIFEFPGDVKQSTAGTLIAERGYDGSVDRDSIRNQDVENANIVHITDREASEERGFYIVADNGDSINWTNIFLWSAIGVLSLGLLFLIFLFIKRKRMEKQKDAPARRAISDPHEITLDNPNPYKDDPKEKKRKVQRAGGLAAAAAVTKDPEPEESVKEMTDGLNDDNEYHNNDLTSSDEDQVSASEDSESYQDDDDEDMDSDDLTKPAEESERVEDSEDFYDEDDYSDEEDVGSNQMSSDMFFDDNK